MTDSGIMVVSPARSTFIFTKLGILAPDTSVNLAILVPYNISAVSARLYAKEAPVGMDIIVDINKNGTTIFTTQANRPRIPMGQKKGDASPTPDVASLAEGDVLTFDIDEVGMFPGSDLTVEVKCQE